MESSPNRPRVWLTAFVIALTVSTLAARRQNDRDRLEVGGDPGAMLRIAHPESPSHFELSRRPASMPGAERPEPSVQAPAATVTAPGDLEAMATETFGDAVPGLRDCLRAERVTRPGVTGKLPVVVGVSAAGLIVHVDLGPSTIRSESFDECATLTLAQLVFPEATPRELSITFDLR